MPTIDISDTPTTTDGAAGDRRDRRRPRAPLPVCTPSTEQDHATATRFDVRSPDGTPLAVWVDGEGPALVLVHGSPSDHSTFDPLVQELRGDFTTFAMDRRGSGGSGDTTPYAIEREFEDVAAVADAAAARTGGPVALWGHSYGCNPAMGGAALTTEVHRLVLYEPSFGLTYPAGSIETIEAAVAAGDPEAAIRAAFVDTGVMTDEEFEAFKATPRWPGVLAVAATLPRECRVEHTWAYRPGQFDTITAPTLLLTGSATDPALAELTHRAAAAVPDAKIRVLGGHGHFAHKTDPAMVAAIIQDWIGSSPGSGRPQTPNRRKGAPATGGNGRDAASPSDHAGAT